MAYGYKENITPHKIGKSPKQNRKIPLGTSSKNSFIDLVIRDNGGGFGVDETFSGGFERGLGLSRMKERALVSGGLFQIESTPGKGTIILVSWPFA